MPQRFKFSEDERRNAIHRAAELVTTDGLSQTKACEAVATDLGLSSPRTIAIWAVDLGEPLPSGASARAQSIKAREANIVYNQLARMDLSDNLFRKLAQIAATITEAGDMWKISTAFSVLTQTRRLEEGKATSNTAFAVQGQTNEPQNLKELATGIQVQEMPQNVSPLARREA